MAVFIDVPVFQFPAVFFFSFFFFLFLPSEFRLKIISKDSGRRGNLVDFNPVWGFNCALSVFDIVPVIFLSRGFPISPSTLSTIKKAELPRKENLW